MTPAIRFLSHLGVSFSMHEYDCDVHDDFGQYAASQLQISPDLVYKTLLVEFHDGAAVALVPASRQLDLKGIARVLHTKKVEMMPANKAERVTGYKVGGISPFAQKKSLPTVLDSGALGQERILVSGGQRGLSIGIAPQDLQALLDAVSAAIAR